MQDPVNSDPGLGPRQQVALVRDWQWNEGEDTGTGYGNRPRTRDTEWDMERDSEM